MKQWPLLILLILVATLAGCASYSMVQVEIRHRETLGPVENASIYFREYVDYRQCHYGPPTDSAGEAVFRLPPELWMVVFVEADGFMDHYNKQPRAYGDIEDSDWVGLTITDAQAGGVFLEMRTRLLK